MREIIKANSEMSERRQQSKMLQSDETVAMKVQRRDVDQAVTLRHSDQHFLSQCNKPITHAYTSV